MGVAQVDVIALLAAELRFVGFLHAGLAHIVAALVLGVFLDVVGVDFRDVAQQVAAGVEGVGARGARHAREAGEEEALLDELAVLLAGHLALEDERLVADLAAVEPVFPEALLDEGRVEVEDPAEGQRVEFLDVVGRDHDVVGQLVVHDHFAVAVEDAAAGRVDGLVFEGVVLGRDAVFLVENLDLEEPESDHRKDDDDGSHDDAPAVLERIHVSFRF